MKGIWRGLNGREKMLVAMAGVGLLLLVVDYQYRLVTGQRQLLEQQAALLRASLQQGELIPSVTRQTEVGDPMPLLLDPPHLRLLSLSVEKGKEGSKEKGKEVVLVTMEGTFADFMSYLRRLEKVSAGWRWSEIDFKVKSYPQAEIRLQLLKPTAPPG